MCNWTFCKYLGLVSLFYICGAVVALGSVAVAKLSL